MLLTERSFHIDNMENHIDILNSGDLNRLRAYV
jgi:hypothetical protein